MVRTKKSTLTAVPSCNCSEHSPRPGNRGEGEKMPRIAQCSCGALRVETTGEPAIVSACHCRECQRRTGAPYGVGAYFSKAQVRAEGTSKVFARDGQEGRKLRFHFCPECGTTLFWSADFRPDDFGVAVGAFADPSFPAPTRSVWEESRHSWITFEHDLRRFAKAAGAQPAKRN